MASVINDSPRNAFLSLRSRLRTPESSQQFSGRVATGATQADGSKIQDHLQRGLRKILASHLSSEKQKDGTSKGDNYTLLEQLTSRNQRPKPMQTNVRFTKAALASLAATGSNLHQQSTAEIQKNHGEIQSKIERLSEESSAALAISAQLYQVIAEPFAELAYVCSDGCEETISERTACAKEQLEAASEKLDGLYEQWQACVRAEQEAWKRLTDEEDEPRQELELHDLAGAMEKVMGNAETEINSIEAEYAEYIQIESLKVMQTLMQG